MATLIGLSIRVRLLRTLPKRFKVNLPYALLYNCAKLGQVYSSQVPILKKVHVEIYPGTHASRDAVNKQLKDKERVAAALENAHLLDVVNKCIATA